jgi:hypothetical protein
VPGLRRSLADRLRHRLERPAMTSILGRNGLLKPQGGASRRCPECGMSPRHGRRT